MIAIPENKLVKILSYLNEWGYDEDKLRRFFINNIEFTIDGLREIMSCNYDNAVVCVTRLYRYDMLTRRCSMFTEEKVIYTVTPTFIEILNHLIAGEKHE